MNRKDMVAVLVAVAAVVVGIVALALSGGDEGPAGASGAKGAAGVQGVAGSAGAAGAFGTTGEKGARGDAGPVGSPGPEKGTFLAVSPTTIAQGGVIDVSGAGFTPGDSFVAVLFSDASPDGQIVLSGGDVNAFGAFSSAGAAATARNLVRTTVKPGDYTVQAKDSKGLVASAYLKVITPPPPPVK